MTKRINLLLWLVVFAVLLVYLGFTAWLAAAGLAYPYQLDYGEGAMLEQAKLISQGRSIYKGMEGYPYAFSNYPPLVQTLAAILIPALRVECPGMLVNRNQVDVMALLNQRVKPEN